jgi:type IV pilus assembly protein PilO
MAIDINTIKKLDPKIKALIVFLAFLLIGYLYWFTFLSAEFETKSSLSTQLSEMQAKIKEQEKIAVQLKKYITDVAALQASYKIALQKLPDQREIPSLFHSVASAGKDAGIEFVLFEPKASVPKTLDTQTPGSTTAALLKPSDQRDQKPVAPADSKKAAPEPFYEEIPVAVSVLGSYQNILYFFDKVAKLPRIVNISDISIGDRKDLKGRAILTSSFTIQTYMFIDKKIKPSEKIK